MISFLVLIMKIVKQPKSPRAQENEYADVLEFMTEQISERFKNGVLLEMNKSTVDKFADAQVGNYASIMMKLANKVKRKILKQFNDDRIQQMIADKIAKVDKRQQKQLYGSVEKAIGINTKQLVSKEGLTPELNALLIESTQWAKKLRDETMEKMINDTLFDMTNGKSLAEIMEKFDDITETRKGHARFLAHNQIQNYNALSGKLRAQKLGAKRGIWDTAGDESVRPSHADRDGKEFDLSEGLYSSLDKKRLTPGVDYSCRCTVRYILEDD